MGSRRTHKKNRRLPNGNVEEVRKGESETETQIGC